MNAASTAVSYPKCTGLQDGEEEINVEQQVGVISLESGALGWGLQCDSPGWTQRLELREEWGLSVVGSAGVALGLGESLLLRLSGSWGSWQLQHLTAATLRLFTGAPLSWEAVFCVLPRGLGRG